MTLTKLNIVFVFTTYCCLVNCSPSQNTQVSVYQGVYGTVTRASDVQTIPNALYTDGSVVFIRQDQWQLIFPQIEAMSTNISPDNLEKWDFLLPKAILQAHQIEVVSIDKDSIYRANIKLDKYIVCLADLAKASSPENLLPIHVLGCIRINISRIPLRIDLGYGEVGAFKIDN